MLPYPDNHLESQVCQSPLFLFDMGAFTYNTFSGIHALVSIDAVPFCVFPTGMKVVCLALVQALGRLNPFPV